MKGLFAIATATVGFWLLVFWAADAFDPAELAAIGAAAVLLVGLWMWWEVRHAIQDPHDRADLYPPADWDWPGEREDVSSVRHGGLGR